MAVGVFSVSRDIFDHPVVGRDPDRFRAWLWMVSQACWKPAKFNVKGKTVTVERGQFVTSVRRLADELRWSKSATHRFLTRLKTDTMIETESGTGQIVITICNYEKYQLSPTASGTASGTGAGQERDTKEEGNKVNKKREGKPSPKKGSRLPEDWTLPRLWGQWALEQKLTEKQVRDQAERFRDYWVGVPGQKGVKLNWQATWRNWIRSAVARDAGYVNGSSHHQRTASDAIMAELRSEDAAKAARTLSTAGRPPRPDERMVEERRRGAA